MICLQIQIWIRGPKLDTILSTVLKILKTNITYKIYELLNCSFSPEVGTLSYRSAMLFTPLEHRERWLIHSEEWAIL